MIYTSYFSAAGFGRKGRGELTFFSIAGKSPDWFEPEFIRYGKLAPKYSWWSEWKNLFSGRTECRESIDWYTKKYSETVLSKLDPAQVRDELESMSNGKNACLLCWEAPGKFCHRHLVSDWFNAAGIACAEIY